MHYQAGAHTWILIIILFSLPPKICYLTRSTIYGCSAPGLLPPGHMESYCYILFQKMAISSARMWLWDAVDESYYACHVYAVMVLVDILGSAKLRGMTGHAAVYRDHFTAVKGACSSLKAGWKYQYHPVNLPTASKAVLYRFLQATIPGGKGLL